MEALLPTIWFILIAVLWIGYLVLEGFDLGVGMHMLTRGRTDKERRVMLNTIGPVWDGNEVWLLTAGGATFAAFPFWYASLFSALYIPLTLALLALIFRNVAIEYRGKGKTQAWRTFWDWAMGLGSFLAAFCVGALLAITTTGLPLNANGDREGGAFAWLTIYAVIGGLGAVGYAYVQGATFLALKTDGEVRDRAKSFVVRWMPVLILPLAVWAIIIQLQTGEIWTWAVLVLAVLAAAAAWVSARAGREGWAFIAFSGFLALGAVSIFGAVYPVVLPSTIDPAYSLTIENASSSPYTLGVMSLVALFGVPIVLAYQAWSYWVFKKRLSVEQIPDQHVIEPAIAQH